jgi:hypothetical protein
MQHRRAWGSWALGLGVVLTLLAGCADLGKLGAKMHGLEGRVLDLDVVVL